MQIQIELTDHIPLRFIEFRASMGLGVDRVIVEACPRYRKGRF
jgi:hypothetical protein